MRRSAWRCHGRCPVHPAEDDIGAAAADGVGYLLAMKGRQKRREATAGDGKSGRAKPRHPVAIRPDHELLGHASFMKGDGKPLEEQFGAAMSRAGHELEKPRRRT